MAPCTGELASHRRRMVLAPPSLQPDGSVPFRRGWLLGVPRAEGVYLIHDIRGPLYIGRAENLRRRFEEHYLDSHNPSLRLALRSGVGQLLFSWVLVAGPEQVELERELIRSLRPLCNVQHNTTC
jgi:excinuclease UvrABC nuclease subunit